MCMRKSFHVLNSTVWLTAKCINQLQKNNRLKNLDSYDQWTQVDASRFEFGILTEKQYSQF